MANFFNRRFGSSNESEGGDLQSSGSSELPTLPLDIDDMRSRSAPITREPIQIGVGSSVGKQRDHNEDALFAMGTILISNRVVRSMGLFIVADGMGGHLHGEKASELAVQAMAGTVIPQLAPPALGLDSDLTDHHLQEIMSEGVNAAHKSIQENAAGGGSTLTGLLILGDKVTIAHIGDSRAYHFDGENPPKVLTTDHSLVKRLEDLGQITPDEAAIHPQRNVLYRALGQVEQVDADLVSTALPPNGYLVVCSDGLWGLVADHEISRITRNAADPQQACSSLLEAANAAGGPDNISVIIIKIPE